MWISGHNCHWPCQAGQWMFHVLLDGFLCCCRCSHCLYCPISLDLAACCVGMMSTYCLCRIAFQQVILHIRQLCFHIQCLESHNKHSLHLWSRHNCCQCHHCMFLLLNNLKSLGNRSQAIFRMNHRIALSQRRPQIALGSLEFGLASMSCALHKKYLALCMS